MSSATPPWVLGLTALEGVLALPRGQQRAALDALRRALPDEEAAPEAWNTAFGAASLYGAWAQTPVMRGLYEANRELLRAWLRGREGWTVLEIGGGDGTLWQGLLADDAVGTVVVVDPHPEPAARVAARLPPGVRVEARRAPVERADLPEADAAVMSLMLHHVAGRDAAARAAVGLSGPGKLEVLQRVATALTPRRGMLVLNEADVHCDLELAPGDPLLADRLLDSYVRRCARALIAPIRDAARDPSPSAADLAARWWTIVRRWCLDQLDAAALPYADRDVYELDVPRWEALIDAAGLRLLRRGFTDDASLFCQYVAQAPPPRPASDDLSATRR
jgi:hypothetical protein